MVCTARNLAQCRVAQGTCVRLGGAGRNTTLASEGSRAARGLTVSEIIGEPESFECLLSEFLHTHT